MKNKLIRISVAAVIAIIVIVYYFPQSLNKTVIPDSKISIYKCSSNVIDGSANNKLDTYEFLPDTEGYNKLTSILDKYSYHRYLGSLFTTNGYVSPPNPNYDISFNGEYIGDYTIYDGGKVLIDSHPYKIGCWEKSQNKFMEELDAILSTQPLVKVQG